MSFNISYIYRAIDKFTPIANKIAGSVKGLKLAITQTKASMNDFSKSMAASVTSSNQMANGLNRVTLSAKRLGSALRLNNAIQNGILNPVINPESPSDTKPRRKNLGIGASFSRIGASMKATGASMSMYLTAPIVGIGIASLKASAEIETMEKSFGVILGSASKGRELMTSMKQLTLDTPYQLKQVGDSARILLASGVPMEDINKKMMMLGDTAAGANMPIENMAAIFAKVKNQGRAMAREINQLNKTPIRNILKGMLHHKDGTELSSKEFTKMISRGEISPQMFETAIKKMTQVGGVYHDKMKAMMETLAGRWSNFKDAVYLASGIVGDTLVNIFHLKTVIGNLSVAIINAANAFKRWTEAHPVLTRIIGLFLLITMAIGPVLWLFGLLAGGIGNVILVVGGLTAAFNFLTIAFALTPLGRFVALVTLAVGAIYLLWDGLKGLYNWIFNNEEPLPDWLQKIVDAKNGNLTISKGDFDQKPVSMGSDLPAVNNSKVDVKISLEQIPGFNARATGTLIGNAPGSLGLSMGGG